MYSSEPPAVPHKDYIPTVSVTLPEPYRNSVYANGSELAYEQPQTRTIDLSKPGVLVSAPPRGSSLRPVSDYSATIRTTPVKVEDRRASTGHAHSPSPRPSSSSRRSSPRPASLLALPAVPASTQPTPPPTPPPQPISPTLLASGLPSPTPSLPLKHPPPTPVSWTGPGSKTSLVPSEGEDLDGFHVRNTYAQLEMSGVKGDGYEEGVERTRARIGASRASQFLAESAIGNGTEKSQELDPREIQTLVAVDRYGFFSTPSHDRLVLLPSAPLVKRLAVARAGPSSSKPSAQSLDSVPAAPLPLKEASRIAKWTRMMEPQTRDQGTNTQTWRVKPSKQGKLRLRTYKGIPDRWRPAAWDMFMNSMSETSPAELARLGEQYRDGLDKPSTYDIQIDLDVPRTISGHIMFRTRYGAGQRSLFHVLHCFSLRCSECGYVQGMGPIAATLLCYFDPEKAYASLVRLHDAYGMHTIFSPGFPGLLEAIYVQERITEQMMPDVYGAFKKHMISTTSYATKWYITLFSNSVPFQTQLRLWDAFLLDGTDLFVAVAVAIVWAYRDHITSAAANFETILSLLSSFFVPEDEDSLLLWIEKTLGDNKLRASMAQWRSDWKALVASGQDATALL
ncbi:rab-GTPase-TBC domain-containing protein [Mycena alexandri]|uniref:Rab-GTPase-TBC domain-containing protein n=1 Tax=Mycena alexandri TaxID=1745969 RepID=A0AAD6T6V1_9AGAR|nr:rab-GTPase-TBC domain-containing protein [Mycena alexandri]KAJ7040232.1 rab-GTPase-TBC domain-containing protein [Mycena alexandri]